MRGRNTKRQDPDTFVVDSTYLRTAIGEAVRNFVAPLAGVYAAATGRQVSGRTPSGTERVAIKVSARAAKRRARND